MLSVTVIGPLAIPVAGADIADHHQIAANPDQAARSVVVGLRGFDDGAVPIGLRNDVVAAGQRVGRDLQHRRCRGGPASRKLADRPAADELVVGTDGAVRRQIESGGRRCRCARALILRRVGDGNRAAGRPGGRNGDRADRSGRVPP